ncbi:tumor necrosis factor receptor superfamily member 1A isoform X3 [Sebastes umbrosus]|uniref:tumor necrosis factor receptor superfamily member 1A isoform X3 n=1 Tax=Sebastes umbrosus TaxID=72105 RepID=UPI0018A07780|nr:tumor necrosis factor receptor superfamily member 1A isoform X3 [Sebastes umbrosus]
MEGAGQRGRWNTKAPVGTILMLLMCMFIPTLTSLLPSEEEKCPHGDYPAGKGICCNRCSPGFKLVEKCNATGQRSNCTACPDEQYTDQMNFFPNCHRCKRCKGKHEVTVSKCERYRNTICQCKTGYYKDNIDSQTSQCLPCKPCGQDEILKQTCTPEKDTVCECKENYYRVRRNCKLCNNCSVECKHHCLSPGILNTKVPEPESGNGYLINIIAGVVVVAMISIVLVVVITHVATKWSTKKKLLKPSTQPSDASPDSCEQVLIQSEEPSDNMTVTAVPQSPVSEHEPSNLPDCVPLEVKISDVIYTVLDLVPVSQMKQLVRSLGVTDTEIGQAEMDHLRACREAHYQMLRVWAERGSRAGGGERGRMLHGPFLQELLDKLRDMHLGRAAEELETKYGIQ